MHCKNSASRSINNERAWVTNHTGTDVSLEELTARASEEGGNQRSA
jgi:hypothetical protein